MTDRIRRFIANTAQNVKDLFALHFSPEAKSERVQRAYHLDSTRSWVDPNGYKLSDRVWLQRRRLRARIDQELRRAVADGTDANDLARALEQYLVPQVRPIRGIAGDLLPNQAKGVITRTARGGPGSYPARRLARTEISRAHFEATRFAALRTPFAIGMKWNLSAAHPEVDECDQFAGEDNGLGRGVYRVGDFPTMPQHPNCFPAGTRVIAPNVEASSERWYDGDLIEIRTASGNFLAGTPNHPVLTPEGWVPLSALDVGSQVVSGTRSQSAVSSIHPDNDHAESLIEDVAVSLDGSALVSAVAVPTTAEYFHNDGVGSEISVIRTDGHLRDRLNAAFGEPRLQQDLGGGSADLPFLPRSSVLALGVERRGSASGGGVRSGRYSLALRFVDLRVGEQDGFVGAAQGSVCGEQMTADDGTRDAIGEGEALFRLPSDISADNFSSFFRSKYDLLDGRLATPVAPEQPAFFEESGEPHLTHAGEPRGLSHGHSTDVVLDRVLDRSVRRFSGHVYNLQTATGWYIANGIIVHNCLCFATIETNPDTNAVIAQLRKEFRLDE